MITEQFKKLVDGESPIVDAIIPLLYHSKKESARKFLVLMNDIIDYYLLLGREENTIRYPIIYLPNTPDWGRKVLLEFLVIKLALYYNEDTRNTLRKRLNKGSLYFPGLSETESTKRIKYEIGLKKYIRPFLDQNNINFIGKSGHKNLIFCQETDLMQQREDRKQRKDKNRYIEELFGTTDDFDSSGSVTVCTNITAKDIRKKRKKDTSDETPTIDNLFVLYTNNDQCNSLYDVSLEKIKQLQNCFVFRFSSKPERVYRTLQQRKNFHSKFLTNPQESHWKYPHYIAFSQEESLYLFGNVNYTIRHIIEDDQLLFNECIGSIYSNSEHPIADRLLFSLCLDQEMKQEQEEAFHKQHPECADEVFRLSFDYQLDVAKNKVIPIIKDFLGTATQLAIILPCKLPLSFELMFQRLLPNIRISFYPLSALRVKKRKNGITEDLIVNFVYRPHYARFLYHKYPNSFDSYILADGQKLLEVIQGFVFGDMYLWDKYDYESLRKNVFQSSIYRKSRIGIIEEPKRPDVQRVEARESVFDDEKSNRTIPAFNVTFCDGQKTSIPETELLVIKIGNRNIVSTLNEVDDMQQIAALQRLDEVRAELALLMEQKATEAEGAEKIIRQQFYKQGIISEMDYKSSIYLWKLLLSKKIDIAGEEEVYVEIMNMLDTRNRIQKVAFKHWIDKENPMILPLHRNTQRKLIEYLGLPPLYLSIMRRKKWAIKSNTQMLNGLIDKFIADVLYQDSDTWEWEDFKNTEVIDILNIETEKDLRAVVQIMEEKVNPKQVEQITSKADESN